MDEYYTTCAVPKDMRVIDLQALKAYQAAHPICEMPGCMERSMRTPHHIKHRGSGGGDIPDNLISLCIAHHSRVHSEAKFKQYVEKVKYGIQSVGGFPCSIPWSIGDGDDSTPAPAGGHEEG